MINVASGSYWFTGQVFEFFICHEMLIHTTSSLVHTLQYHHSAYSLTVQSSYRLSDVMAVPCA